MPSNDRRWEALQWLKQEIMEMDGYYISGSLVGGIIYAEAMIHSNLPNLTMEERKGERQEMHDIIMRRWQDTFPDVATNMSLSLYN